MAAWPGSHVRPKAKARAKARARLLAGMAAVALTIACVSGCTANAFENLKVQVGVSQARVDGRDLIVFTLGAFNAGESPIRLQFSSGLQFDFVVVRGQDEVWRWSSGKAAIMMLTEREIQPGELALHSVVWDGRDESGAPVPAGEYEVFAEVLTRPRFTTARTRFTL